MPAHKAPRDSLSVLQEYRGFILDSGSFDGAGQGGGHTRLSPAYKELLVETDMMAEIEFIYLHEQRKQLKVRAPVSRGAAKLPER